MIHKELYSVPELCHLLGYPLAKSETVLGKAVAKAYREAGLGEPQTALRNIRERNVTVKVYEPNNPVIEEAIKKYYAVQHSLVIRE